MSAVQEYEIHVDSCPVCSAAEAEYGLQDHKGIYAASCPEGQDLYDRAFVENAQKQMVEDGVRQAELE